MKKVSLLICFILFSIALFAQQKYELSQCEIQLAGTSTLHDWTANVEDIDGSGTFELAEGGLTAITSIEVTMRAESIKSNKGAMMDKNIYKALKVKDFPTLTFDLTAIKKMQKAGKEYEVMASGLLTVAGVAKPINLSVSAQENSLGKWIFTGATELKMSDFKVDPPELFFGSLKTADEMTIIFEATFSL